MRDMDEGSNHECGNKIKQNGGSMRFWDFICSISTLIFMYISQSQKLIYKNHKNTLNDYYVPFCDKYSMILYTYMSYIQVCTDWRGYSG